MRFINLLVLFTTFCFLFGCRPSQQQPSQQQGIKSTPTTQQTQSNQEFLDQLAETDKWMKDYHDRPTVEDCADFKKNLYASGLDKKQKDLIWDAVLVGSEYCWEVDTPRPKDSKKPGLQKPAKKSVSSK